MKKFFSLMMAVVAAVAIQADNYYLGGINGQWPEPGSNPAYQLTGEAETLTCSFDRIDEGSEIKVFVGEGWGHVEYGAAEEGVTITPNGDACTLVEAGKNVKVALAEKHYLKDAVVSFNTTTLALTVTGTDVDGSQEADVYCLVGACTNNWSTADALEFVDVQGVLTVNVADLNGGFKIIKNHKWGWEAGAPTTTDKLAFDTDMILATTGAQNIVLSNPFGGYKNAVLTLDVTNEEAPVLKLIDGEFAMTQDNWYFPGSVLGWNCNDDTRFDPVPGQENTYEFAAAEFGKDFKVVYGVWGVEFGAPKGETLNWVTNTPMELATPCDNVTAEDNELILQEVIATIHVDYENVKLTLTLECEETALEQIAAQKGAQKIIENGQLIIVKNGIRFTAKGAKL